MDKRRRTLPGVIVAERYELVELIGEGGMATVWRGVQHGAAGFERPVAIKKMKPEFRALKNYLAMFVEEARVGAELAHPNIVQVFDFCRDLEGAHYLIMEWVEGVDLHAFADGFKQVGHLPDWELVAAAGIGALRGLAAAHERVRDGVLSPVIHRDVSPHNILLGVHGTAKLTDFGLARASDRAFSLTAPGMVKGKLSYLSPEILDGAGASVATDIFSMGSCLWETLACERAFEAKSDVEVFRRISTGDVRALSTVRSDVPGEFERVIARALAVDPAKRFATAREMANALAEVLRLASAGDYQARLGQSVASIRRNTTDGSSTPETSQLSLASLVMNVEFSSSSAKRVPGSDSLLIEFSESASTEPTEE